MVTGSLCRGGSLTNSCVSVGMPLSVCGVRFYHHDAVRVAWALLAVLFCRSVLRTPKAAVMPGGFLERLETYIWLYSPKIHCSSVVWIWSWVLRERRR